MLPILQLDVLGTPPSTWPQEAQTAAFFLFSP